MAFIVISEFQIKFIWLDRFSTFNGVLNCSFHNIKLFEKELRILISISFGNAFFIGLIDRGGYERLNPFPSARVTSRRGSQVLKGDGYGFRCGLPFSKCPLEHKLKFSFPILKISVSFWVLRKKNKTKQMSLLIQGFYLPTNVIVDVGFLSVNKCHCILQGVMQSF